MGVKIGPGFKRIRELFAEESIVDFAEVAMQEAIDAGVDAALDAIDTSGNPDKAWVNPFPVFFENSGRKMQPTADRVDTGSMRDDIGGRVYRSKRNTISGEVGWINGSESYYKYQEYGFTHWITGQYITGMGALRSAKETTEMVFRDRIEREVERHFYK